GFGEPRAFFVDDISLGIFDDFALVRLFGRNQVIPQAEEAGHLGGRPEIARIANPRKQEFEAVFALYMSKAWPNFAEGALGFDILQHGIQFVRVLRQDRFVGIRVSPQKLLQSVAYGIVFRMIAKLIDLLFYFTRKI